MAETYSLAKAGRGSGHGEQNNTNLVTLPDSAARDGDIIGLAMTGQPILCKMFDGSFANLVIDPERSTTLVPVLKRI